MTAEDVVLNYQYHMNPDTASAAGGCYLKLKQFLLMEMTGYFKLKGANADWPAITTDYHIMIKPTKDGVVDAQSTVGTGPTLWMNLIQVLEQNLEKEIQIISKVIVLHTLIQLK